MGVGIQYRNFVLSISEPGASCEQKVPFCRTAWWFCGCVDDRNAWKKHYQAFLKRKSITSCITET